VKKIIISTESGTDLPLDLAKLYNIKVIPMHIAMDNKDYLDGSIPVTDVYDYHQRTKKIPSTSATNPQEYHCFFQNIMEKNPDCIIIHIAYSSKASCTYQNAIIASEEMENIYFVDSLNVSGGEAAIVLKAVELVEKNPDMPPADMVKEIEIYVKMARASFIPGSLEYLKAGGRVSNAAYLGASLLQLKPLIEIVDGNLVGTKKYRGKMSHIIKEYFNDYFDRYNMDKEQIYLLYSLGLNEQIKDNMEEIVKEKGFKKIIWIQTGCVISTHGGPGAMGIAGFENIQ